MTPPPKPEGIGVVLPKSPHDVMRMIHAQNKKMKDNVKKTSSATVDTVANKSEQQSESLEAKLMELEDYTFKREGVHRLLRVYEIISMENEDELSARLAIIVKQDIAKLALREQLRKEVEERKEQELRDKEERKRQAELRRQAVVERIRKKAEDEERMRLDAENAIKQREIDRIAAIQLEYDNMIVDQQTMTLEEARSHLAEAEYEEQLKRKIWQLQEKEKMLEWERQQKIKDELEDQKRLERMAVLEERKQKLLKLQQQGGGDVKPNAKEEADKLNKQLRIQNKAKFVTKKIQTAASASVTTTAVKNDEDAVVVVQSDNIDSVINASLSTSVKDVTATNATVSVEPVVVVTAEQIKFAKEIENISSESVLKELQKELMDEKRTLRLEQRIKMKAVNDPNSGVQHTQQQPPPQSSLLTSASTAANQSFAVNTDSSFIVADALKQSIEDVTYKESIVEKCLEKLTAQSKAVEEATMSHLQPIVEQPSDIGVGVSGNSSSHNNSSNTGGLVGSVHGDSRGKLVRTNSIKASSSMSIKTSTATANVTPFVISNPGIAGVTSDSDGIKNVSAANIHKLERVGTKPLLVDLGSSSSTKDVMTSKASTTAVGIADPVIQSVVESVKATVVPVNGANALFKQAENMLRESKQLLDWSTHYIKSIRSGSTTICVGGLEGQSEEQQQQHANLRRMTVLVMEIPQLVKSIGKEFDPLGYKEQLATMGTKVKDMLTTVNSTTAEVTVAASVVASSPSKKVQSINNVKKSSSENVAVQSTQQSVKDPMLTSASVNNLQPDIKRANTSSSSPLNDSSDGNGETYAEEVLSDDELEAEQVILNIPGWDECINTTMATAAHHAAFYGYVKVLEVLCQYFDCFVMDKKGRTPLFYACLQNQLDCVACLVSLNPAWIDVGDMAGDAPLHAAAIANGIEVLRFLLSCEAHPDTANYSGLTPSHLARTKDALVVLYEAKALLYCVDNKNRMPLWYAATDGRADCCNFLCSVMPYNFMLYKDDEGDSALHKASANGHADCVEVICSFLQGVEDLYVVNKKSHTASHVASNSAVLKALYENGANLFSCDPKARNSLFFASFFGRLDCIIFLIEIAFSIHEKELKNALLPQGAAGSARNAVRQLSPRAAGGKNITQSHAADVPECLKAVDSQGDGALHVACLCGHIQCVNVLCYYLLNLPNHQGITPEQLATKAGHLSIAKLVGYYDMQRTRMWAEVVEDVDDTSDSNHNINTVFSMQAVYGCDFNTLVSTLQYYGSRWHQGFDPNFKSFYYIDNAIVGYSQWERPETYDENLKHEEHFRSACDVLYLFYSRYNPEKIADINHILTAFRNNYTELFISLANKYNVEDLSMFSGVDFD